MATKKKKGATPEAETARRETAAMRAYEAALKQYETAMDLLRKGDYGAAREAFLQGVETERAFSFVIDEASGRMTVAVSLDGMSVSVFGACTDADGYYTIEGVPLGVQNVIVGWDFCGPHPYLEQTFEGVLLTEAEPNVSGIDFVMVEGG